MTSVGIESVAVSSGCMEVNPSYQRPLLVQQSGVIGKVLSSRPRADNTLPRLSGDSASAHLFLPHNVREQGLLCCEVTFVAFLTAVAVNVLHLNVKGKGKAIPVTGRRGP
jgi:hypothetical protein